MRSMRPDKDICVQKIGIPSGKRRIPALVLSPQEASQQATGILWIHGGGYITGMKEMVHMSRAVNLVKQFGAVVISPGYRLAPLAPFPAALDDCYAALLFLRKHAGKLGVREDQLMVGGESAGGGLCAAVCRKPVIQARRMSRSKCRSIPCWTTETRKAPAITADGCGTPEKITWHGAAICGGRTGRICRPMPPPPV